MTCQNKLAQKKRDFEGKIAALRDTSLVDATRVVNDWREVIRKLRDNFKQVEIEGLFYVFKNDTRKPVITEETTIKTIEFPSGASILNYFKRSSRCVRLRFM
ncbi:MAG: uncharacterized protein A8A55_2398 [Amphiamblys sp. WSBS2006]|nr:MAG: uncharacterized protein A8A55_2398 [Amphiamblys sp. WSBS2006]